MLIRHVYTGRFPEKHLFSARKPMLISSGVKDIATTSGAARAVNLLKQDVAPGTRFGGPSALEEGTQLLYYSPAVASPLITISIQMVFEDFDKTLFQRVGQLFTNLSGVPIFMPAAGYLMGAGSILKLAGELGGSLLNGHTVLAEQLSLDFSFGGGKIPKPGFWVLSSNPLELDDFDFDSDNGLLMKTTGKPYDGDEPVVVVSLDGKEQASLANFTPLLATASLLGRFFNQKEGSEVLMDTVLDAMKLSNDLTYRRKAEGVKKRMVGIAPDSEDGKKLKDEFEAFNKNITESRLQLPSLTSGA
jgi:hypothetical protein